MSSPTTSSSSDPPTELEQLMSRGSMIKRFKELEAQAILESSLDQDLPGDPSQSTKETTDEQGYLLYDSFLSNQLYFDDLKHVNYPGISYTYPKNLYNNNEEITLNISQDKSLGKGGILWDAAFILSEYVLEKKLCATDSTIIELGAGCGLVGVLLNKLGLNCLTTDLQSHLPLMMSNFKQNNLPTENAQVMEWGVHDNSHLTKYDFVIGADIVASLYNPELLAETIYRIVKETGRGYISFKGREEQYHVRFEKRMKELFSFWEVDTAAGSRNKNSGVGIICFSGKIK
ncbi:hypothetical protein TrLO_g12793 [Triparma laevis f. longispina]|uniref:Uncharacterized protein n=1 Tax=Triparma laevis f. longispina TaxID=1714387 RepID=A0A9W7DTA1_9STRA|nr:hypothetical protein TrLO_g12793 [Triparma laevis f. longispina]